jgi:hypothetical protein
LAKKYGFSDNGLRKVYKALAVPLPARGHWAKVAAGRVIPAPPLPPFEGSTSCHSRGGPDKASARSDPDPWLAQRLAVEAAPANAVSVAQELIKPHRLVAATGRAFKAMQVGLEASRDRINERAKRPSGATWHPTRNPPPHWQDYVRKGHIPDLPSDVLPMRVSLEAGDRTLRIWDALVKASVARGMSVEAAHGRLVLGIRGEQIELRMTERMERVVGPTKGLSQGEILMKMHVHRVAKGELRLVLGRKYHEAHRMAYRNRRLNPLSLPEAWMNFMRQSFEPVGEISKYMPPPSASLYDFSLGLACPWCREPESNRHAVSSAGF